MKVDNLILEIRNEIVKGVIGAIRAGVPCEMPKCFEFKRTYQEGISIELQVGIKLSNKEFEEYHRLSNENIK